MASAPSFPSPAPYIHRVNWAAGYARKDALTNFKEGGPTNVQRHHKHHQTGMARINLELSKSASPQTSLIHGRLLSLLRYGGPERVGPAVTLLMNTDALLQGVLPMP
ncbi:uncharacterized protein N7496_012453 [Penicillium cataractarum]|uniref:Uncharacterized protein n=1 Tax=Penicillium cataractarum TaxID=2100454 RepID=A0A9W9UUI4_9EURO|nr:uncharacterized protein N7496_012453 [Penicillium cataractarum]KAJ5355241.1 hypothetical protein N7496_012453 [Penicillium cataractarum]